MHFKHVSKIVVGDWRNLAEITNLIGVQVDEMHCQRQSQLSIAIAHDFSPHQPLQTFILAFQVFDALNLLPLGLSAASDHFTQFQPDYLRLL
jgi:hypothetical protein